MNKWFLPPWLLCAFSACAQKDNALALTHMTVIDCTGAAPTPNSTVVITGSRISAVGPSETVKIPAGARVVDASS